MTGKKPLIIEVSTEKEWLTLLTLQVRREISKYYVKKKRIIFHKKNNLLKFIVYFILWNIIRNRSCSQYSKIII